jgi:hypothetical protein
MVHANLPQNDYSSLSMNEQIADVRLGETVGGGQAWVTVEQGEVQSVVFQPRLERLDFSMDSGVPTFAA